jgi:hypothetical protein
MEQKDWQEFTIWEKMDYVNKMTIQQIKEYLEWNKFGKNYLEKMTLIYKKAKASLLSY